MKHHLTRSHIAPTRGWPHLRAGPARRNYPPPWLVGDVSVGRCGARFDGKGCGSTMKLARRPSPGWRCSRARGHRRSACSRAAPCRRGRAGRAPDGRLGCPRHPGASDRFGTCGPSARPGRARRDPRAGAGTLHGVRTRGASSWAGASRAHAELGRPGQLTPEGAIHMMRVNPGRSGPSHSPA